MILLALWLLINLAAFGIYWRRYKQALKAEHKPRREPKLPLFLIFDQQWKTAYEESC
jgi:hypothetical protein